MRKKLIITESQYKKLEQILTENTAHSNMVRQMKEFLDYGYEPVQKFVREGGEYYNRPMIMIKLDEEIISPKALFEYLKSKFNAGDEFTKQVIRDWVSGNISEDYQLSKNVSME